MFNEGLAAIGLGPFLSSDEPSRKEVTVTPETYEVVAKGSLSPALLSAMGGFEVVSVKHGLSHLVGPIPDQYRMRQVRELLEDMNVELVSINEVRQCDHPGCTEVALATVNLCQPHADESIEELHLALATVEVKCPKCGAFAAERLSWHHCERPGPQPDGREV
jgi:hypothetical protein